MCAGLYQRGLNTEDVGWGLWLRGFSVGADLWQKPFVQAGMTIDALIQALMIVDTTDQSPSLSDAADDMLLEASKSSKKLSFLRRRLKGALIDFVTIASTVAIGAFYRGGDEEDLIRTLGRALGTVQPEKKAKRMAFVSLPIEGETLAEQLDLMSSAFRDVDVKQMIRNLRSNEAASIRDELLFLHRNLRMVTLKDAGPKDVVLDLIERIFDLEDRRVGATAISIWLVAREVPSWRERLEDLRSRIALRATAGALEGVL